MPDIKTKIKNSMSPDSPAYRAGSFIHCAFQEGWKVAVRREREKRQEIRARKDRALNSRLPAAERERQEREVFSRPLCFSILVPLMNPETAQLKQLLKSVTDQTCSRWELCLADGSSEDRQEAEVFFRTAAKGDSRIRYWRRKPGTDAARWTWEWMGETTGDVFLTMGQEDLLHPSALYYAARVISDEQADLIYTDEAGYLRESREMISPKYKPDYAPDSLRGNPYLGRGLFFSRELAKRCGNAVAQALSRGDDYDLMLRLTEQAEWIRHIPRCLYFRPAEAKAELNEKTEQAALENHLRRMNMRGVVQTGSAPGTWRIRYEIEGAPMISVVIPNRDHAEELRRCLRSIREKTTWKNYEILIIENNSTEPDTFTLYREVEKQKGIRVLEWTKPFNFSAINNFAAEKARGQYLLMLNNDTEVLSPDWLQEMLMYAQRDDVGAVGAKMYYPDGTIQHAGIGVGLMHSAGHYHRRFDGREQGYMARLAYPQDLSAVTGACMMVSRKLYRDIGGMDESFPLVYNDVDFCLKLRREGYLIVWTPYAELIHDESRTRGSDTNSPEKEAFFRKESRRFQNRWNEELTRGDPYYNVNLTLSREDFSPRAPEPADPLPEKMKEELKPAEKAVQKKPERIDWATVRNRTKTRIRNYFWTHSWHKKLIPDRVRKKFSSRILGHLESRTEPPKPYIAGAYPPGVNLYGFFKAENGLAQGVKLYAGALAKTGIPYTLLNTDFLGWLQQEDMTFADRLTTENRYAINVIHINPDQWQEAVGEFPRSQFDGHYNIGVFLWELETIPDYWKEMLDYVDEVWTPSEFIARAIRKETEKPVTVIPYGIETPWDETLTRKDFGIGETDFAVLMMFDSNSFASRKNPGGAMAAFREAFGDTPEHATLVVKINNPKEEDLAFIRENAGDNVILITERMDKQRLNSLIRLCDVYISLHRSEGFGLVMAEAMSLGVPVVATNWSANTEFMPPETACMVDYRLIPVNNAYQFDNGKLVWADADTHQAAVCLRRLREDAPFRKEKAQAGQQYIRTHVTPEQSAEKMRTRVEEILKNS